MRHRLRIRWICSAYFRHRHRWYWSAWLCGWLQYQSAGVVNVNARPSADLELVGVKRGVCNSDPTRTECGRIRDPGTTGPRPWHGRDEAVTRSFISGFFRAWRPWGERGPLGKSGWAVRIVGVARTCTPALRSRGSGEAGEAALVLPARRYRGLDRKGRPRVGGTGADRGRGSGKRGAAQGIAARAGGDSVNLAGGCQAVQRIGDPMKKTSKSLFRQ